MKTREILGQGLRRATRWRLLLLCALFTAIPAALATVPVWRFLDGMLAHAPRAELLARGLEGSWLPDLARALGESPQARGMPGWILSALGVAFLLAPALAGAVLAEAGSGRPLPFRLLLTGAGRYFARMVRTAIVGVIPLGLAGAIVWAISNRTSRSVASAVTEASASASVRLAIAAGALVLVVAHLTLDAGRAGFAAQPHRRSALLSWFRGTWLVVRHPVRSAAIALTGLILGPGLGLLVMAVRERLPARPGWAVVAGVLLAQVAAMAVGWGRAVRVAALVRLVRDDREARLLRRSPPPLRQAGEQRDHELGEQHLGDEVGLALEGERAGGGGGALPG